MNPNDMAFVILGVVFIAGITLICLWDYVKQRQKKGQSR